MKSMYPKRHILATLLTGFVIVSASSVAAQPTTAHQEQDHREHQVQNRQGQQKQQRQNRQSQQQEQQRQNRQGQQGQQRQNHQGHQGHQGHNKGAIETSTAKAAVAKAQTLPALPTNLPNWIDNKDRNHIYRKRGSYNDAVYNIRPLALDLNALAVGHAFAYEDLVTGKAKDLETKFDFIHLSQVQGQQA